MSKTFLDIGIDKLGIDKRYQRDLDEKRAQAIADNFDDALFSVIVVSRRADGSFFVIDGQHRVKALRIRGFTGKIHCEVIDDLDVHGEAAIFVATQKGRASLKAFDSYRASLVARDPEATAIDKTVRGVGLRVTKGPQPNGVRAVKHLERAYRDGVLPQVLATLVGWNGPPPVDHSFVDKGCIPALAALFKAYPTAVPNDVVQALVGKARISPARLLTDIIIKKETLRSSFDEAALIVLVNRYNGRHKGAPLKRK